MQYLDHSRPEVNGDSSKLAVHGVERQRDVDRTAHDSYRQRSDSMAHLASTRSSSSWPPSMPHARRSLPWTNRRRGVETGKGAPARLPVLRSWAAPALSPLVVERRAIRLSSPPSGSGDQLAAGRGASASYVPTTHNNQEMGALRGRTMWPKEVGHPRNNKSVRQCEVVEWCFPMATRLELDGR